MLTNSTHRNMLISPARSITARVELYVGSTRYYTFNYNDYLSSFTISRAGANKFFGFGVCQEIEVKLVDKEREIEIEEDDELRVWFTANKSNITPAPKFYVTEANRNENTNEITVKGYDAIHNAKKFTIADLELEAPYTVMDIVSKAASILETSFSLEVVSRDAFNIEYPNGANLEGTETLREVLDAIAEITQTIYYMNNSNKLVFKSLDVSGEPVLTIGKADYFTLESKGYRTLANICSATELGDNITTTTGVIGETQYVRNNPFWELREDIVTLLENAIASTMGLTINQFNCKWRANYLLEPGDKIAIVAKDDNTIISYLLDDKYTYNGGLAADTLWQFGGNDGESADNPVTLGDALKKTYAKVDKANAEIEIVAGQTAAIKLTTDGITSSVSQMDENLTEVIAEVNTKVTAEDVSFTIQSAMGEGIERVTTTTGFTFNEEGLHISKENSEITTSITEDGMKVFKNNTEVLVADNLGVKAEDLHATTFLIIGNNSRLEDYGNRTGCFWIGG